MATYRYFNPTQDLKMAGLKPDLLALLDRARGIAGIPFIITSGLRSQDENDALPTAVKNSAHLTGEAVDLSYTNSGQRFLILKGLYAVGFKRIGMGSTYIHADISTTLPEEKFFLEDGLIC